MEFTSSEAQSQANVGKLCNLGEAKLGSFRTRRFPTFSGKVQIVSQTLSGLFLVGAFCRERGKGPIGNIPEEDVEYLGRIGKVPKGQKGAKRTKKEGQVSPDRETTSFKNRKKKPVYRVHAKGVVLCERACFCLLSAF